MIIIYIALLAIECFMLDPAHNSNILLFSPYLLSIVGCHLTHVDATSLVIQTSTFFSIRNSDYDYETYNLVTYRYMFIEYGTLAHAKEAVRALNGHRLDKNHVFDVNFFSDFDKYTNVSDEWQEPSFTPYKDLVSFICSPWCEDCHLELAPTI